MQIHSFSQHPPVSFFLDNLEQDTSYRIILFAVNPKGRSEPTIIDDINFKGIAKYTGTLRSFGQQLLALLVYVGRWENKETF